jgi:hypothetical protein
MAAGGRSRPRRPGPHRGDDRAPAARGIAVTLIGYTIICGQAGPSSWCDMSPSPRKPTSRSSASTTSCGWTRKATLRTRRAWPVRLPPNSTCFPTWPFATGGGVGVAQQGTPKVRSRGIVGEGGRCAASLVSTPCFATLGTVRPRHPFLKIASSHRRARLDLFGATPFRLEPGSLP